MGGIRDSREPGEEGRARGDWWQLFAGWMQGDSFSKRASAYQVIARDYFISVQCIHLQKYPTPIRPSTLDAF